MCAPRSRRQVREQLQAKDSWGRTVLTYAVLSGYTEVFEVAFHAIRGQILDYEVRGGPGRGGMAPPGPVPEHERRRLAGRPGRVPHSRARAWA